MDAVEVLSRMLSRVNANAAQTFVLPVVEHEKAQQQIQARMQRLIRKTSSYKSHIDFIERIKAAVQACRSGAELDFRELRLACLGCTMTLLPDGYTLLEDRNALDRLLYLVDNTSNQPRLFAKFYGRLLKAYFGHPDASEEGEGHREHLREFLATRKEIAASLQPLPIWGHVIREYPDLLERRPGHKFTDEILAGEWSGFEKVCERLGLTGETWLSGAVLFNATRTATGAGDQYFKNHISVLLQVIGEKRFSSLRDKILAELIQRYEKCEVRDVHNKLRDFAVMAWKNPWLPLNQTSWGRVSDTARQMMSNWLKEHLIYEFFNVLAEDGRGDRGRFEFWRRYLDQIDDIYFILGRQTLLSADPNIRTLRRQLEGRLINLLGTEPANNAFVMRVQNAVIVEFSRVNNAAYTYFSQNLPFSLDGVRSVDISDLKFDKKNRFLHVNGGHSWQEKFEQKLLASFGLRPDGNTPTVKRPALPPASDGRPTAQRSQNGFNEVEFSHLMEREKFKWEDLRSKGGNLWVLSHQLQTHVRAQLMDWGFKFKPGRGWWLQTVED